MAERRRSGRSGSGGGGKDDGPPKTRSCGTMVVHERLLRSDPSYQAARNDSENRAFTYARRPDFLVGRRGVTVIPTVVHVVYNGAAQNISDGQVQSQIDVLTHDFRKTNADISTLPAVFQPLAADARIAFELATTDPSSNPTNGITRTSTSATGFTDDNKVKKASTGGADAWPRDNYLNLWVCRLSGGLLGYAQFPGGPADTDGVVILDTACGTSGTAAAPFDLGRTATHEIGHWLNLRHIWGDDGGGCNGDDFVADTPNCADDNMGKPTFPHITCSNGPNGDMFMNYMDYTDDDSMFMFTQGQADRMQACLDHDRSTIGFQKPPAVAAGEPIGYFTPSPLYDAGRVVYRGADGHVYELYLTPSQNGSWEFADLTAMTSAPVAAGEPAGYYTPSPLYDAARVVYRGADQHLYELYLTPSQNGTWAYADLTAMTSAPGAAGEPAGYYTPSPLYDAARVAYRGADQHIYELYLTPSQNGT